MTDHFAVLGMDPSPALDVESLRAAFEERSRRLHPDVAGGNGLEFREVNAAYQTLREPARRLRHLLELRAPEFLQVSRPPDAEAVEWFMQAGELLQRLDALAAREQAAASPLARALLAPEKMVLMDALQKIIAILESAQAEAGREVEAMTPDWDSPDGLRRIAALQPRLTFLAKWAATLRERLLSLEL